MVALISCYNHVVYTVGGSYVFGSERAYALLKNLRERVPSDATSADSLDLAGLFALQASAETFQQNRRNRIRNWQRRTPNFAGHTPELGDARVWVFVSHAVTAAQHTINWASPAAERHLPFEEWSLLAHAVNDTAE